jgi:hypothetical protein
MTYEVRLKWDKDNGVILSTGNPKWRICPQAMGGRGVPRYTQVIQTVCDTLAEELQVEIALILPAFEEGNEWTAVVYCWKWESSRVLRGEVKYDDRGVHFEHLNKHLNIIFRDL